MIPKLRDLMNRIRPHNLAEREELHKFWMNPGDGNRPEDYIAPVERSEFLYEFLADYMNPGDAILEPGCNVGRNLNYLHQQGFTDLAGIEINGEALLAFKHEYPETWSETDIYSGPIEDHITEFPDDSVNVTYTYAVLEHIHPDSDFVFDEFVRITSDYICTIEDEVTVHWREIPRNYKEVFENLGCRQVKEFEAVEEETDLPRFYFARLFEA